MTTPPPPVVPEPSYLSLVRRLALQLWIRWRAFGRRVDDDVKIAILEWLTVVATVRHLRGLVEGLRRDLDATAREAARWRKLATRRPDLARLYNQILDEEERRGHRDPD